MSSGQWFYSRSAHGQCFRKGSGSLTARCGPIGAPTVSLRCSANNGATIRNASTSRVRVASFGGKNITSTESFPQGTVPLFSGFAYPLHRFSHQRSIQLRPLDRPLSHNALTPFCALSSQKLRKRRIPGTYDDACLPGKGVFSYSEGSQCPEILKKRPTSTRRRIKIKIRVRRNKTRIIKTGIPACKNNWAIETKTQS